VREVEEDGNELVDEVLEGYIFEEEMGRKGKFLGAGVKRT